MRKLKIKIIKGKPNQDFVKALLKKIEK